MSFRPRFRTVALFGSLVAGAVFLAAFVERDGIRRAWYLHRLRDEPGLFETELLSTDTAVRAAIERFLAEDEGRQHLFELYLDEFERTQWQGSVFHQIRQVEQNDLAGGILALGETGYAMRTEWGPARRHSQASMGLPPESPERRKRVIELLSHLDGWTGYSPRFPLFEFRFEPAGDGEPRTVTWSEDEAPSRFPRREKIVWRERQKGVDFICFFRVLAKEREGDGP